MAAVIDIAPGAENVPLAVELAGLVRANVAAHAAKCAEFEKLRGAVAIVADDEGTAFTLRFDFGRLVVHTGVVGTPDVTIRGPTWLLESLRDLPQKSLPRLLASALRRTGRLGALQVSASRSGANGQSRQNGQDGELKIYGFLTHPLLVSRLFSVLSR